MLRIIFLVLVLAKAICLQAQEPNLLHKLIEELPTYKTFMASAPDSFELQVIYRPLSGPDSGYTYSHNVDPHRYFYPASTVKLPAAILTLEWLSEQGIEGLGLNSACFFSQSRPEQIPSPAYGIANQTRTEPLWEPTLRNFVIDAMVVSDNMAYNRLFDLLGARHFNRSLHQRGWPTRIVHRVGVGGYNAESNQYIPAISVTEDLFSDRPTVYSRGPAFAKTPYKVSANDERKGVGRYIDSSKTVIAEPFDFSSKNFIALEDLAEILQTVVAPETVDSNKHFYLNEAHRQFLLEQLSIRPAESENPAHHDKDDGYVNFLYYGGEGSWEPDGPKIYNKVGDAYGYLTEVAIFEDQDSGLKYLLAATIHVNKNRIYNDGKYEYDSIGLPFLKELGKAVWEYANR